MTQGPGAPRHEEFRLDGSDLMDKARQLIDQGNRRRLVVRNEDGKSVFDLPLTVAVVGGVIVFPAAAVGAIAALATRHSIVVEAIDDEPGSPTGPSAANGATPSDDTAGAADPEPPFGTPAEPPPDNG